MPNLFIVGAAKSGTTSLWAYLKNHSRVFMPKEIMYKEPAYFSELKSGLAKDQYFRLFADVKATTKYVGEASTAYLTDPVSASRIYDYNPHARIVIMLRNPVDRAYSLYKWMVQDGYEYAQDFTTALRLESSRVGSIIPNNVEIEYYYNYLYAKSGLYSEQVHRYLNLYSKNVCIICFEQFCRNAEYEIEKLCDFLNIDYESIPLKRENASRPVFNTALQHRLRLFTAYLARRGYLSSRNKKMRDILISLGIKRFSKHPPLTESTRRQLQDYYKEDVDLLSNTTGIDFSKHWF